MKHSKKNLRVIDAYMTSERYIVLSVWSTINTLQSLLKLFLKSSYLAEIHSVSWFPKHFLWQDLSNPIKTWQYLRTHPHTADFLFSAACRSSEFWMCKRSLSFNVFHMGLLHDASSPFPVVHIQKTLTVCCHRSAWG